MALVRVVAHARPGRLRCGKPDYVLLGQDFANLGPSTVVVVAVATGRVVSVTDSLAVSLSPQWSRDGSRLFFVSNRDGPRDVYAVSLDADGHSQGEQARITTASRALDIARCKGSA
jgi:Tol biopolymer transport system component